MPAAPERRTRPRAPYTGIAVVKTGDHELPCMGGDISERGMLLFPVRDVPVTVGQRIAIRFALPGGHESLTLRGKVVRRTRQAPAAAWGVRFKWIPLRARRSLRAYVSTRLRA